MTKRLWLGIGHLSFALAIVGIVLPLLPTTPFLMLSATSYLKSSDKAYQRLIKHPQFGETISQFMVEKSISQTNLVKALALLWSSIIISLLMIQSIYLKVMLVMIAITVSLYLISMHKKKE